MEIQAPSAFAAVTADWQCRCSAAASQYAWSPANLSPSPEDSSSTAPQDGGGEGDGAASPRTFQSLARPLPPASPAHILPGSPTGAAQGSTARCSSTGEVGQVLAFASAQPSTERWRAEYVTIISKVLQRVGRGALCRASVLGHARTKSQ
eukprot:TRINITY_DN9588_c0_g1_i1.p1 TRINITY_DN9588_c0_g1~~TRINITY_DN9588_c0_g1_i1.p1  ORF type:complete len:150 (+),score=20.75 TRINITY_DN9588_c0_g1_i1:115-564(+)